VRFWDSSAFVPTLTVEPTTTRMRGLLADDDAVTVWWATVVECSSAIARRERATALDRDRAVATFAALADLATRWSEIPPTQQLRDDARRLVRVHDLRAADALQLAAARVAADGDPGTLPFVTLDDRLALAASREGFPILGLGSA
jgi:predicted nucleic acid-binding protein